MHTECRTADGLTVRPARNEQRTERHGCRKNWRLIGHAPRARSEERRTAARARASADVARQGVRGAAAPPRRSAATRERSETQWSGKPKFASAGVGNRTGARRAPRDRGKGAAPPKQKWTADGGQYRCQIEHLAADDRGCPTAPTARNAATGRFAPTVAVSLM